MQLPYIVKQITQERLFCHFSAKTQNQQSAAIHRQVPTLVFAQFCFSFRARRRQHVKSTGLSAAFLI
jgi:hypothetical protein